MKVIIHIIFILICASAFGQDWRDSLDMARDAYKNEEFLKALEYYESAQKGAPENVDLSDEMAQSAYKAREFKKAEDIYKQNGNNKQSATEKADNYHNIGNARLKQKDYQGAIDSYKESLRLNPNDDQTRYNLSEAIRQLKNQQKNQNKGPGENGNGGENQNDKNGDGENQAGGEGNKPKEGQLKNKTAEAMLDKLMKEEAETKRKLTCSKGRNSASKSGKDW